MSPWSSRASATSGTDARLLLAPAISLCHPSLMTFRGFLGLTQATAALLTVGLAACARSPVPPPPVAGVTGSGKDAPPAVAKSREIRKAGGNQQAPRLEPAILRKPPQVRPSPTPSAKPAPSPTPAQVSEDWVSLVRKGIPERSAEGRLAFQPTVATPEDTSASLFEDAITLNAVRASLLKSLGHQNDRPTPQVRVREGVVYLALPPDSSAAASASAVDAALESQGVRKVIVESSP